MRQRKPRVTAAIYEGFGQYKTAEEWSCDKRCVVRLNTLGKRLSLGWPVGAALVLTAKETRRGWVAFNETKNLVGWLADRRCAVPASILKQRLEAGEPFKAALTRREPSVEPEQFTGVRGLEADAPSRRRKYWAFGEGRTLNNWAADDRFNVAYPALKGRVREGIPVEAALLFTTGELYVLHWAFGERKALTHWLRDPRCDLPARILKARLDRGELLDVALTRGDDEPPNADNENLTKLEKTYGITKVTIFGETKSINAWVKDDRCEISYPTLFDRIKRGWPHEPSLLRRAATETKFSHQFFARLPSGEEVGPFENLKMATRFISEAGGVGVAVNVVTGKNVSIPRRRSLASKKKQAPKQLTAWGETKSLSDWARDPRCVVKHQTLYVRLRTLGINWTPEKALTAPAQALFVGTKMHEEARLFEAFGQSKSLVDWAKDPRCDVALTSLRNRLRKGIPLEEALRMIGPYLD